jgi:hypothetical protein
LGHKRPVETGGDLRVHGPNVDWGGDQSGAGYIRLGALQFCWGSVRFTGRYGEMGFETPFPAPFAVLPAVVVTLDDPGYGLATPTSSVASYAVRTNAFVVLYKGGSGARIGPLTASWVVMGRWR